jgi:AcrR family transcriptional regulator
MSRTATAGATGATDGRRARAQRSRRAAVDAILELIEGGAPDLPTVDDVAARSGISARTVFRQFDDLESLYGAAVEAQADRLGHLFEFEPTVGPLAGRVDAIVDQRVRLFDATFAVRCVAERLRPKSPVIDRRLRAIERRQAHDVRAQFASELDAADAADAVDGADLADALTSALSWSVWFQLRDRQGLSRTRAATAMTLTVTTLLVL